MTPRIYHNNFPAADDVRDGFSLTLTKDKSHHLIRVLRKRKGDTLHVFDGSGNAWAAHITAADSNACELCINESLTVAMSEPPPIHVGQCVCAPAKMDWLLEKCTELGIQTFTPLHSSKTETKAVTAARSTRQQARWQRLIIAACEQCGRNHLPTLNPMRPLTDFATAANKDALKLHLTPHTNTPLGKHLQTPPPYPNTILLIGPESGFTESESQTLTEHGFAPVTLNPATLRTETAAPAALAILNHPLS